VERDDRRAAAELRRVDAEAEKLKVETEKLRVEARRLRQGTVMDGAKLALAVFAAVLAALELFRRLGWL